MKRRMISVIIVLILSLLLTSCGNNYKSDKKIENIICGFNIENELPGVNISNSDYQTFLNYINYESIECPHSEIFGLQDAFSKKESRTFDTQEHTYSFFDGASFVDSQKLFDVVKNNNKNYMTEGVHKQFNDNLSDSKLKECCEIVADTLNRGIENVSGIDLDELGCILGNLKILERHLMDLGQFDDDKDLLIVSPTMIKAKKRSSGISNIYEITISHEAMHILQCRCTDVDCAEGDSFIGTSYSFGDLDINPLKNSWLYEASAELNTTLNYGIYPTTYTYMIDNLESISLATVLNDNVKPRQLEKLCFTQDVDAVYKQLEFSDKTKAAEFLYAVELMRTKPEEFKSAYEKAYSTSIEDYSDFLNKTYNPYFVEVVSKLLYKNLALKLTQNEMSLNDVFYVISLYELDLLKDIPLDHSATREKYTGIYENYLDLQKTFFELLQKSTDADIPNSFMQYQINYENGSLYANATLDWLDDTKKDYLLFRNNILYDKTYKCILSY